MLQNLKIENYALIREMDTDFSKGFIAITGETGAGKSIMLGALSLVLGQRADTSVLLNKDKKCIVEATFNLNNTFNSFFEENGLDFDTQTIFRREILNSGKSRAFINDTPVQLSVMKELGDKLMDIHSQFNTITLKGSEFQFTIVDSYVDDKSIFIEYENLYKEWKKLQTQIKELETKESELQRDLSYNQFLFDELDNAKLSESEQEELEQEVELMSNAEEIKSSIVNSLNILDQDELGALAIINQAKQNISKITSHHNRIQEIYTRLESNYIELKDIVSELVDFNDTINFDAEKLELSNSRLDLIYSLEKKHSVESIKELLFIQQELDTKLSLSSTLSEEIEELKKKSDEIYSKLLDLSKQITEKRKTSGRKIEQEVSPLLSDMGMSDAILKINITETGNLALNGANEIEFLFNANKGGELNPISKVISGGELSRLMLALKAVMSKKSSMPTIIFDEIDSGVSGDIASKVGNIMRMMSQEHQLVAITHLPQIAAKANNHYKVYKKTVDDTTVSEMRLLNYDQRVEELALMLSSDNITTAALENARELLS